MSYRNVLLIDDDEDDQEIFLTAAGRISRALNCTALFDAREALTKLSNKEIRPDVIFLDLNMPSMNGKQFLTEIKKSISLRAIPVIVFSTTANPNTIRDVKELGAVDFITKPGLFDDLVKVLRPLLS